MELFNLLKLWRNRTPEVNKDSFDVSVTSAQCDFDEFSMKNKSSIVISRSVDNDTNKQFVHKNLSNIDGEANANAFNANVVSLERNLHTNLKSQSPVLILGSSPKLRVFMPGLKNSSSLEKTEFNCMTTPKREKSEDSSSNKYLKLIKPFYVKASKIRIFDQSVAANSRADGEKQQGSSRPAAVFREVCKSLMKSKSSVRTVPVPVSRRDDSVLQQEDGIQSAILHCKRSYSSSSSSSSSLFSTISQECTVLSRSASESSNQKATINPQIIASTEGEMK